MDDVDVFEVAQPHVQLPSQLPCVVLAVEVERQCRVHTRKVHVGRESPPTLVIQSTTGWDTDEVPYCRSFSPRRQKGRIHPPLPFFPHTGFFYLREPTEPDDVILPLFRPPSLVMGESVWP